jgi:hypothetical protein
MTSYFAKIAFVMLINYKYEGLSPKESDIYTKTNTLVEVDRS